MREEVAVRMQKEVLKRSYKNIETEHMEKLYYSKKKAREATSSARAEKQRAKRYTSTSK